MGADWDLSQEIAALLARAEKTSSDAGQRDHRTSDRDTTVYRSGYVALPRTA